MRTNRIRTPRTPAAAVEELEYCRAQFEKWVSRRAGHRIVVELSVHAHLLDDPDHARELAEAAPASWAHAKPHTDSEGQTFAWVQSKGSPGYSVIYYQPPTPAPTFEQLAAEADAQQPTAAGHLIQMEPAADECPF